MVVNTIVTFWELKVYFYGTLIIGYKIIVTFWDLTFLDNAFKCGSVTFCELTFLEWTFWE